MSAISVVAGPLPPSNSSARLAQLLPWDMRLVALLVVNMGILTAAWIAVDRVWPWTINMGKGSFNQGVMLAVAVCGGWIAALAAKSKWRGLDLAVMWAFAIGYTVVTIRWMRSSPGFFARHHDEIIANSTLCGLRTLAMFTAACFVTLWWRCSISQAKTQHAAARPQFHLEAISKPELSQYYSAVA